MAGSHSADGELQWVKIVLQGGARAPVKAAVIGQFWVHLDIKDPRFWAVTHSKTSHLVLNEVEHDEALELATRLSALSGWEDVSRDGDSIVGFSDELRQHARDVVKPFKESIEQRQKARLAGKNEHELLLDMVEELEEHLDWFFSELSSIRKKL